MPPPSSKSALLDLPQCFFARPGALSTGFWESNRFGEWIGRSGSSSAPSTSSAATLNGFTNPLKSRMGRKSLGKD
jgi:hypothetical protein